jgi:ATP-dependent DNA ligase
MMKTFPTLYQKTATGSINYWQVWTNDAVVCTQWGQLETGSPQQQSYEAKPTNIGKANQRLGPAQAEFEAKSLWNKKRRLKYFESIQEAEGELNLKPMLCQEYKKRKGHLLFPVSVQPKLDGFRCFAYRKQDRIQLLSRGGVFYTAGHIAGELQSVLPNEWILDGELYIHGMSLQNIGSLIKRPRPESVALNYYIYDCTLGRGEPWSMREEFLGHVATWIKNFRYVRILDTYDGIDSHERIEQLHDAFVSDGYEGIIVRTPDHPYRFGYRSPGLLKLKNFEDKEFPITDWTTDKDGTLMWVVRQEDGLHFPVRPMGTDEERAQMLMEADRHIGKELTVRFQGRTDKNIPKFARGVIIRDAADK